MANLEIDGKIIQVDDEVVKDDKTLKDALSGILPFLDRCRIERQTQPDGKLLVRILKEAGPKGNTLLEVLTNAENKVNPAFEILNKVKAMEANSQPDFAALFLLSPEILQCIKDAEQESTDYKVLIRLLKEIPPIPSSYVPEGF